MPRLPLCWRGCARRWRPRASRAPRAILRDGCRWLIGGCWLATPWVRGLGRRWIASRRRAARSRCGTDTMLRNLTLLSLVTHLVSLAATQTAFGENFLLLRWIA